MTIGDGDDRRLVQEKQKFKPLVRFFRRPHQGNVEPAREQPWQQPDSFVLRQFHRDIRSLLAKIVKQHRKKAGGSAIDRADADGRPCFRPLAWNLAARLSACEHRRGLP